MKAGPPGEIFTAKNERSIREFTCTGCRLGWYSSSSEESEGNSTSPNVAILYNIYSNGIIYNT